MDTRPRFTRITGQLSGVQVDESDMGDPEEISPIPPRDTRAPIRFDFGLASTFDPLSDPLDDPFPEELR